MKKVIFTLALVLGFMSIGSLKAQDSKMWVGGSVGVKTSKEKDGDRLTDVNVIPEIGYILNENWGIGFRLGYTHQEFAGDEAKIKADGFTVNPFTRFSFLKGSIGALFVDGGVGYTYLKFKDGEDDLKSHQLEVGFRPGVAVNVSDNIALTGKFGFLGYQYDKLGDRKVNTFGFDIDMSQVEFGVSLLF